MTVSNGALDPVTLRSAGSAYHNQRLKDAKSMVSTLVIDEDGQSLAEMLEIARRQPSFDNNPRGGVVLDRARVFHFRSSQPDECLPGNEAKHYRSFTMPAGSRVIKLSGAGYGSWVLRVDNGQEGDQWLYLLIAYRDILRIKQPVLKSCRLPDSERTGRQAGMRSRGAGPDRSVSR